MTQEQLKERSAIFTAAEIHQQPATWKKTFEQIQTLKPELEAFLNNVLKKDDYDIILTGAGTSEFVGNSTYAFLNRLLSNYKVKSYGTTDLVACPENYLSKDKTTLLISYGRSGNSPESVGAVNVANEVCGEHVYHLFITCNKEGALSKAAQNNDHAFAINLTDETHDQSFAMTSSYSNMYLATVLCFYLNQLEEIEASLDAMAQAGVKLLEQDFTRLEALVKSYDFKRIVYLGSGSLKGVAQESALKMLELTAGQTVTMYDTALGFRHGPKSIINDETLTVVYLSDDPYTFQYELDLIKEMSAQRKGNKIFAVSHGERPEVESLVDFFYAFKKQAPLDNVFLGLDYILVAQLLALYKSLSLDITPDNPCPSGEVNRVVKGVILYPYQKH